MAMPRKLKFLNTFLDGVSYLGVIESVTLPKLTRKLEKLPGRRDVGIGPGRFRPRR
ncbi:phage major tail tube protein [Raoultella terrigena]|uniref:Phage major tail tube protein n=1 Tax=Raoultella terrigena TaxID=577 RepID=A0A3P8IV00_RAOTE|nr:phage major tail tube protein [Raoultella terrigena]